MRKFTKIAVVPVLVLIAGLVMSACSITTNGMWQTYKATETSPTATSVTYTFAYNKSYGNYFASTTGGTRAAATRNKNMLTIVKDTSGENPTYVISNIVVFIKGDVTSLVTNGSEVTYYKVNTQTPTVRTHTQSISNKFFSTLKASSVNATMIAITPANNFIVAADNIDIKKDLKITIKYKTHASQSDAEAITLNFTFKLGKANLK